MTDFTRINPNRLSARDRKMRAWQVSLDKKAQEAQDYVNRTEVIDGRWKRKLKGGSDEKTLPPPQP